MKRLLAIVGVLCAQSLAWGASAPAINLPPVQSTVFNIAQDNDLWYFNGDFPTNYHTSIIVNAAGPTQGRFEWNVVAGSGAVNLGNATQSITLQDTGNLVVNSAGVSQAPNDVGIDLNYNGKDVGIYHLTVFAPSTALLLSVQHVSSGSFILPDSGFASLAAYQIRDQFGNQLQNPLELNESFGTINDRYPGGSNWASALSANGVITRAQTPSDFSDTYARWGAGWMPNPEPPGNPLSTTEVFNVVQTYRAGSTNPGSGLGFRTQTVHFYLDHALPTQ